MGIECKYEDYLPSACAVVPGMHVPKNTLHEIYDKLNASEKRESSCQLIGPW